MAKISDLGVAKVITHDSKKAMTKAPGTIDFMPPESLTRSPIYGPPVDVFSFAGIILHTFNQQWPYPTEQVQFDPKTRKRVALSEVDRRQQYLDKMKGETEMLRPLVEECLDDDPNVRSTITFVCKRIQVSKDAYKRECQQGVINLYQQMELQKAEIDRLTIINRQTDLEKNQLKLENSQLKSDNSQLKCEVDQLKHQLVSVTLQAIIYCCCSPLPGVIQYK